MKKATLTIIVKCTSQAVTKQFSRPTMIKKPMAEESETLTSSTVTAEAADGVAPLSSYPPSRRMSVMSMRAEESPAEYQMRVAVEESECAKLAERPEGNAHARSMAELLEVCVKGAHR